MLLPPISEQQKICSILGSVDDAIQTTRSVIDQIQTIKQGLSQQLLTRGIGHKRFRKTEIGEIPESWDVVKLKNILSLEYGKNLKKEERDEGKFPVYGSNGIVGYHSDFLIEGPAIIVGRKGTIGAINWSNFNCWPIDTTYYVRVQNYGLDLKWIYYKLESLNLSKLNMATGIPGLNRDMVYTIKIGLPSVAEQSNISKRLLTVDNQIESYKKYLFHLQELKKYLIQDLLTGRVRVKLNEEVAV
jgi:type I restriction enzyme S subunit